jgi:hypothetical protein
MMIMVDGEFKLLLCIQWHVFAVQYIEMFLCNLDDSKLACQIYSEILLAVLPTPDQIFWPDQLQTLTALYLHIDAYILSFAYYFCQRVRKIREIFRLACVP